MWVQYYGDHHAGHRQRRHMFTVVLGLRFQCLAYVITQKYIYIYIRWIALGIKMVKIANVQGFKFFYKTGVKKIQDFKIFI